MARRRKTMENFDAEFDTEFELDQNEFHDDDQINEMWKKWKRKLTPEERAEVRRRFKPYAKLFDDPRLAHWKDQ